MLPPDDFQPRRFYVLPKVHKDSWPDEEMPPGRPIVSDVGSVSRSCANLIEHFLAPIVQRSSSYLRDSLHLIALLDTVELEQDTLFFTMDVVNLYGNIPIKEGLQAVSSAFLQHPDPKRPDLSLLTMLRLLLTRNAFVFNGQQYLQLTGTPMGGAYSGSLACIYMSQWETRTLSHPLQPRMWFRFIDDVVGLWDHGLESLMEFHAFINSFDPHIQLVLHHHPNAIRFLDVELYRGPSKNIGYRIGFKPTDSHRIIPPSSFHPRHVFAGVLFSQVLRWACKSSSYEDFQATRRTVTPVWRSQGHSRTAIRDAVRKVFNLTRQTPTHWPTGFFTCSTYCEVCRHATNKSSFGLKSARRRFRISQRIVCSDTNIIYCIECRSCSGQYVGQSCRPLRRRIAEHLRDIACGRDTAVARHFRACGGHHLLTFFGIERVPDTDRRLEKEAMWIQRLNSAAPNGMNIAEQRDTKPVLVLPYSRCSARVGQLCRSVTSDMTSIVCAKRRSVNLRNILSLSHR